MENVSNLPKSIQAESVVAGCAPERFLKAIESYEECRISVGKEIRASDVTEEEIIFENGYGMAFWNKEEAALYPNTDSAILLEQAMENVGTRYLLVPMKGGEKQKPVYAFYWNESGCPVEIGIKITDKKPVLQNENVIKPAEVEKHQAAPMPKTGQRAVVSAKYAKATAKKQNAQ